MNKKQKKSQIIPNLDLNQEQQNQDHLNISPKMIQENQQTFGFHKSYSQNALGQTKQTPRELTIDNNYTPIQMYKTPKNDLNQQIKFNDNNTIENEIPSSQNNSIQLNNFIKNQQQSQPKSPTQTNEEILNPQTLDPQQQQQQQEEFNIKTLETNNQNQPEILENQIQNQNQMGSLKQLISKTNKQFEQNEQIDTPPDINMNMVDNEIMNSQDNQENYTPRMISQSFSYMNDCSHQVINPDKFSPFPNRGVKLESVQEDQIEEEKLDKFVVSGRKQQPQDNIRNESPPLTQNNQNQKKKSVFSQDSPDFNKQRQQQKLQNLQMQRLNQDKEENNTKKNSPRNISIVFTTTSDLTQQVTPNLAKKLQCQQNNSTISSNKQSTIGLSFQQQSLQQSTLQQYSLRQDTIKDYENVQRHCRICLDNIYEMDKNILNPCNCTGSMRYVHKACLEQYLTTLYKQLKDKQKPVNHFKEDCKCEICQKKYYVKVVQKIGLRKCEAFKTRSLYVKMLLMSFLVFCVFAYFYLQIQNKQLINYPIITQILSAVAGMICASMFGLFTFSSAKLLFVLRERIEFLHSKKDRIERHSKKGKQMQQPQNQV